MISSIFGKTKPINYIIVVVFLFFFYWIAQYKMFSLPFDSGIIASHLFVLITLLFSIFVVDFIARRNKLTSANSFAVLFYGLLVICFWETLSGKNVILCSFFLLLATRRLLSVKSLKDIKYKIFDATLWVFVASLFFDWAILYLLVVFAAIYIYQPKNIKNWLVPISSIFAFSLITYSVLILTNYTIFIENHYQFSFPEDLFNLLNVMASGKLLIFILINILLFVWGFLSLGKSGVGKITTIRLLVLSLILGIVLQILALSSSEYPIMVSFFASSILMANYVESIQKPNIREIVLMLAVFIPFLVFLTGIVLQ